MAIRLSPSKTLGCCHPRRRRLPGTPFSL